MRFRRLGTTGLQVSELCLGAMTFGGATPEDDARRILDAYVEAGGNFVDTAVNYADGRSEEYLGRMIAGRRDELVIATKYSAPLRPGDPNSGGNNAKSLRQALDLSLSRLGTDHVDLYWVHAWDMVTPLEEVMRALDDAARAGKILHAGISNAPAWAVAHANGLAATHGWRRFEAIQIEYNLAARTVERELVPMAGALGLSVLAWGPLSGGLLTGKYVDADGGPPPGRLTPDDRRMTPENLRIARLVADVAGEVGASPGQVALAWLRTRRPSVIPIVGPRTPEQLADALGCLEVELPEDAVRRLDEATAVPLGYPLEFLAGLAARFARPAGAA